MPCQVPLGSMHQVPSNGLSLQYNEFIVYDTAQIKMRYALRMKFNHK